MKETMQQAMRRMFPVQVEQVEQQLSKSVEQRSTRRVRVEQNRITRSVRFAQPQRVRSMEKDSGRGKLSRRSEELPFILQDPITGQPQEYPSREALLRRVGARAIHIVERLLEEREELKVKLKALEEENLELRRYQGP